MLVGGRGRDEADPVSTEAGSARAVLAANQAFYDAFEARDADAMADVWETGDEVTCGHPGHPVLTGTAMVQASWRAILSGPQHLQFILSGVHVVVRGDVAWVVCDENLLDGPTAGTVAAINVFARGVDGRWRLMAHHGSPVADRTR